MLYGLAGSVSLIMAVTVVARLTENDPLRHIRTVTFQP